MASARLQRAGAWCAVISLSGALGVTAWGALTSARGGAIAPGTAASLPPREHGGPLVPIWYYGQTPAQVQGLLGSDNRLVGIQVAQAAPLRLDVAMVANRGSDHKTWWWLPGVGPDCGGSQVGGFAGQHEARIVSLAPYVVDGTTYFAAIYVNSKETDEKGWWWYFDMPRERIDPLLTENGARLVDLRSYSKEGTLYAVVMVSKGGTGEPSSWWYAGVDAAAVRASMNRDRATLTSLEPANRAGTSFDVIMSASAGGTMPVYQNVSWVWATGDTD